MSGDPDRPFRMICLRPFPPLQAATLAVVIGTAATLPVFQPHHGTIATAMAAVPLIPIRWLLND
ncbi:hypothetical protein IQ260_29500 [Leptolyngbya cf. ectocarpi LEGE 11479]|uniref:Uncharacterized protein n=1 Tax=Leptolyngbya cf. ectocarpi LEGE 11479 TaxID=1828722 RepID=A0A929FD57_LEPEC|nr:hypothetical protein [Leptolyngbya ectocarpi]MBE9070777.1 hypothetical protein [Leptolyngbya cf. ectocarpi LEGE 11479]